MEPINIQTIVTLAIIGIALIFSGRTFYRKFWGKNQLDCGTKPGATGCPSGSCDGCIKNQLKEE